MEAAVAELGLADERFGKTNREVQTPRARCPGTTGEDMSRFRLISQNINLAVDAIV